jgi:alpha-ribazole phosphatase/probable phosphoglycerate mutase
MVTKVYLVRHGETEGAEARRYKGHIDVPLSREGIEQMKRLSRFISAEVPKSGRTEVSTELPHFRSSALRAVYCSDLVRAVKSAEIIAEPFGIKTVAVRELRERNFGIWEGMSFDEIKERYPKEFDAWARNPLKFSPMQGESTLDVKKRALQALSKILGSHNGESIAIVSHGGINRILICYFLGIPLENIFRIEQDFGALNIIEFFDTSPVVKLMNYRT